MVTQLNGYVQKGWGSELIFATNDKYSGKLLKFNKGAKFSMHFHAQKDETWYVLSGNFMLKVINTETADESMVALQEGDVWRNEPLNPHQLICIEEGTIIEVSTPDSVEDNYRVGKGDSQQS
jgi:mannose-6-phosphate isomerase-like protein (cupin superfamily)